MQAVVLACAAQVVYIVAFVLFKSAARAMRPLSGRHPAHVVGQAARSARWLAAWWVLMAGFALGGIALVTLPIASALPAYALSLVLLLVVGMRGFGERPTSREWLAVVITVAAMLIAALSVVAGAEHPFASAPARDGDLTAPDALALWKVAVVVVPSLLIPMWMFSSRDRAVAGRHARPITGVAYGVGAGVLLGTCEAFGLGVVLLVHGRHRLDVFGTVHPYLFLLAGAFGLGLLSIGLQRCRLTIIVTVVTVTAKIHLLLAATLLYGEPWPRDLPLFLLRVGAVLLAVLAILAYPRHERTRLPEAPTPRHRAPAHPRDVRTHHHSQPYPQPRPRPRPTAPLLSAPPPPAAPPARRPPPPGPAPAPAPAQVHWSADPGEPR